LEARSAAGAPLRTYLLGDSILGQVGADNALRVFQTDGRGSTRVLTDAQGRATDRYDYDAYGNALGFDPAAAATRVLFTGQQFDPRLGAYNLRSRNYDPATGRFDRMDTFGGEPDSPQSLHRYAYVQGDPVNNTDPSGKFLYVIDLAITNLLG